MVSCNKLREGEGRKAKNISRFRRIDVVKVPWLREKLGSVHIRLARKKRIYIGLKSTIFKSRFYDGELQCLRYVYVKTGNLLASRNVSQKHVKMLP